MIIQTTVEEDKKGQRALEEALDSAYEAGKYDTDGYPNIDQLWETLMKVIGVEA